MPGGCLGTTSVSLARRPMRTLSNVVNTAGSVALLLLGSMACHRQTMPPALPVTLLGPVETGVLVPVLQAVLDSIRFTGGATICAGAWNASTKTLSTIDLRQLDSVRTSRPVVTLGAACGEANRNTSEEIPVLHYTVSGETESPRRVQFYYGTQWREFVCERRIEWHCRAGTWGVMSIRRSTKWH